MHGTKQRQQASTSPAQPGQEQRQFVKAWHGKNSRRCRNVNVNSNNGQRNAFVTLNNTGAATFKRVFNVTGKLTNNVNKQQQYNGLYTNNTQQRNTNGEYLTNVRKQQNNGTWVTHKRPTTGESPPLNNVTGVGCSTITITTTLNAIINE